MQAVTYINETEKSALPVYISLLKEQEEDMYIYDDCITRQKL
jgi:hypothetical protein